METVYVKLDLSRLREGDRISFLGAFDAGFDDGGLLLASYIYTSN
jgi:hypothetical protein